MPGGVVHELPDDLRKALLANAKPSTPGTTSRLSPATSSSVGSKMPSRRRHEPAVFAAPRRSWRKANVGPAAGPGARTATAPVDRRYRTCLMLPLGATVLGWCPGRCSLGCWTATRACAGRSSATSRVSPRTCGGPRVPVSRATRSRVAVEGFGAQLLSHQDEDGQWAGGAYFPADATKDEPGQPWTATTWSLNALREWGVEAAALRPDAAGLLARNARWEYDDLPP